MADPAEQARWAMDYIRQHYAKPPSGSAGMTRAAAETFYEDDEPTKKILAAFDRGPHGRTARPDVADPALRHGGPDAGWYRPDGHGWRRISDGEVSDHGDAAHFMSDPNGRHGTGSGQ